MAKNTGTVVADAIVALGNGATHYDVNGQGALRSVATIADRNAIAIGDSLDEDGLGSGLRKAGMQVKVIEDGFIYELSVVDFLSLTPADRLAALADNSNWQELKFGGSGNNAYYENSYLIDDEDGEPALFVIDANGDSYFVNILTTQNDIIIIPASLAGNIFYLKIENLYTFKKEAGIVINKGETLFISRADNVLLYSGDEEIVIPRNSGIRLAYVEGLQSWVLAGTIATEPTSTNTNVTIEQDLNSNSTTSVPSIAAVNDNNISRDQIINQNYINIGYLSGKIGEPSGLTTQNRSDVVGAINEVNNKVSNVKTTVENTNKNFVGYTRNNGTIYSDFLEDLLEDSRMQFGRVTMRCIRYYMFRDCLNTVAEILDGGGMIYTQEFKLKVPAICRSLRFFGGNINGTGINGRLIAATTTLLASYRVSRYFDCELVNTTLVPDGRVIELVDTRILTQFNEGWEYAEGAGTIYLNGETVITSNITASAATTIIDNRNKNNKQPSFKNLIQTATTLKATSPLYFNLNEVEYTRDGGTPVDFAPAEKSGNDYTITVTQARAVNQVGFRVKSFQGKAPSNWLFNQTAFVFNGPPENYQGIIGPKAENPYLMLTPGDSKLIQSTGNNRDWLFANTYGNFVYANYNSPKDGTTKITADIFCQNRTTVKFLTFSDNGADAGAYEVWVDNAFVTGPVTTYDGNGGGILQRLTTIYLEPGEHTIEFRHVQQIAGIPVTGKSVYFAGLELIVE